MTEHRPPCAACGEPTSGTTMRGLVHVIATVDRSSRSGDALRLLPPGVMGAWGRFWWSGMAERKVTVCSACKRACCFQGAFLCSDAGKAGTVELPVEALRKLGLEHPGYWRDNPGQNDEDIVELAEWAKAQAMDPGMFVAYHVSELGFDPERVYRLLKDVWPEAAAKVHFES